MSPVSCLEGIECKRKKKKKSLCLNNPSKKECLSELEPLIHFQKYTGVVVISSSAFELVAICMV